MTPSYISKVTASLYLEHIRPRYHVLEYTNILNSNKISANIDFAFPLMRKSIFDDGMKWNIFKFVPAL